MNICEFSHKFVHKWKHLKSTVDDLSPQILDAKIGLFVAQTHSQEDRKFLEIVSQGNRHTDDNYYEIPLPFRSEAPFFPENRKQALQIARWLRRRLTKSETFYQDHVTFMNDVITKEKKSQKSAVRSPITENRRNLVYTTSWRLPREKTQQDTSHV